VRAFCVVGLRCAFLSLLFGSFNNNQNLGGECR
jgi:hypothetical protein